jgi:hypothetical protein
MQTYKYQVAIGVGAKISEAPSPMCKWQLISQRHKIESTYANVIFFETCKNFKTCFFISQTWLVP